MEDLEKRARERRERRKRERTRQIRIQITAFICIVILIISTIIIVRSINKNRLKEEAMQSEVSAIKYVANEPPLNVDLLDINDYSRPGTAIDQVNGIVVHYTANPGTSAQQNRDYFNSLAETKETHASSQFIIGLDGEIVQCVPCNEIAYASNDRNNDTVSIECCIEDETGKFNEKTYRSLVWLTTWLMGRYDLNSEDVIRHYDVTGKNCPKYYVENPKEWDKFKDDLLEYIDLNGVEKEITFEESI
ncbi:MAG: peptidoglycan recognition family protein [Agathobacter sp.]|nr:peptidoglycan recognition family protein [Agathobacter sp.]